MWLPPHVRSALDRPACDVRDPLFVETLGACRLKIAALLGVPDWPVVLAAGSGTFGVELVLRNAIAPGDTVLSLDCGTYGGRMARQSELAGGVVRRLCPGLGEVVTPPLLDQALTDQPARWITAVHVEPSTATQLDLHGLAEVARRHDARMLVDGICAAFATEVDLAHESLWAYVTASQKGLALPPGLAVIVVSPALARRAAEVSPHTTGLYGHLAGWLAPGITFTPPMLHVFALAASLDHIEAETIPRRADRHRLYRETIVAWAQRNELDLVASPSARACSVTSLYYPPGRSDPWIGELRGRRDLELAPSNDPRLAGRAFRIGHLGDVPHRHVLEGLQRLDEELSR